MKLRTETIDSFMQWFSWSILLSSFVTLFITFVLAYTMPDKSVTIYINHYGEANLEIFLLLFGAISIVYMIRKGMKDENKNPTNEATE